MSASKRITATIFKEWLLMSRDIGGLLVLLVMPAVLMVIMALVQDAPFRDYQHLNLKILVADEDGGALYPAVRETLVKSKAFTLIDNINGRPVTREQLRASLQNGSFSIGIIIPKGANAEVANAANTVANSLAGQLGNGRLPQRPPRDSLSVRLLFDPVSRPAFRMAVHSALDRAISGATTRLLLQRINRLAGAGSDSTASPDLQKMLEGLSIKEEQVGQQKAAGKHINSVQHNVPAWAIFGMFFIVVPLSGHIIREREQGSALRVKLIPGAAGSVAIGRIIANTLICCLQFVLMSAAGLWLLPLFGLPSLYFGSQPAALIPVVIATGFCATAYGNLVGAFFRSSAQALPFGAISIVILSALGGIWVPVELLPPVLQTLANISPLHWSLQGIHAIILRGQGWGQIIQPTAVLTVLAIIMWLVAQWREHQSKAGL